MAVMTAYSTAASFGTAVTEVANQLASEKPKLIVYFASSVYPPRELASAMEKAFAGATILGCTTAGEIAPGRMLKNSLVAMALGEDIIEDIAVEVIENVKDGDRTREALQALAAHFGKEPLDLDPTEYVGLVLFDGLSGAEEMINDKIGDATNVFFVGGSAGDDLNFSQTHVFLQDRALSNVAVLALIKAAVPFDIIKTQSFIPTGKKFNVTEALESQRTIVKFDGEPAAEVYARAVGRKVEEISEEFMRYPLGLTVEDEPFIRSPQRVQDNNIIFYCAVKEGMVLELMEAQDMIEDTEAAVKAADKELGGIQALIVFNCILRTLQLESEGKTESFGRIFAGYPAVGFSTYGESYIGHINQTATMLAFGTKR